MVDAATSQDGFRFATNYGSNMVLQRAPLNAVLWGFGEENQMVQVQIGVGTPLLTTVKKDFRGNNVWKLKLPVVSAKGPFKINATSIWQKESVSAILENVLFGDVWVCSGQSNMAFTVGMSSTAEEELAIANNYPDVRLFTMTQNLADEPIVDLDPKHVLQNWTVATNASVGGPNWKYFSALCWMYGRRLYDLYKTPIGLVATNWGGTCAEAWSSPDALAKCGLQSQSFAPPIKPYQDPIDLIIKRLGDQNSYSVLWNAMIFPHLNTTIKGAIWYQGERNNIINPSLYSCVFPEMINDWRRKWHEGTNGLTDADFPFGFVQLSAIGDDFFKIRPHFPEIRYEQTANYGYVPNTKQTNVFMAVAMDLPDDKSPYGSIHPRDKGTVADRLVLGARAMVYNEREVNFQGPIMDSCDIIKYDGKYLARVMYRGVEKEGIQLKSLEGFEIRVDESPQWIPISIEEITQDKQGVLLSIPTKNINTIRYAWSYRPCDYKQCAVYSIENDLPSPPAICIIP